MNEQAATGEWPGWRERWERLIEAVGLIRALWTGDEVHHRGRHYVVDGRLYDPPAARTEIPLERVYADWVVSEDPAAHVRALRELLASGATIVNVHSGQADQRRVIDFYGCEVLPSMAARA